MLLRVGRRCSRPCGREQGRLSKMCWLSSWRSLLDRGFSEAVTASRIVGSIHRKEFRLVVYRLSAFFLDVRCCGGHTHVSIQGSYAKPSDTYTDGVALHIAHAFRDALRLLSAEEILEPVVQGHESVMSNEVMLTSRWSVVRDWFCKQSGHIGILEMSSAVSNLVPLSRQHVSVRFCHLVDSAGALSKGRSPSRALKTGAVCVCSDLYPYPGWIYTPTRLNVPMTRPENNLCVLLRRHHFCVLVCLWICSAVLPHRVFASLPQIGCVLFYLRLSCNQSPLFSPLMDCPRGSLPRLVAVLFGFLIAVTSMYVFLLGLQRVGLGLSNVTRSLSVLEVLMALDS